MIELVERAGGVEGGEAGEDVELGHPADWKTVGLLAASFLLSDRLSAPLNLLVEGTRAHGRATAHEEVGITEVAKVPENTICIYGIGGKPGQQWRATVAVYIRSVYLKGRLHRFNFYIPNAYQ